MELPLRGVGFLPPVDAGGGGGFFSSIFDIFGSVAEASPQFLPAITQSSQQAQRRQSPYQQQQYSSLPLLPLAPTPVPAAPDNSLLWLAIAFLAALVVAKG